MFRAIRPLSRAVFPTAAAAVASSSGCGGASSSLAAAGFYKPTSVMALPTLRHHSAPSTTGALRASNRLMARVAGGGQRPPVDNVTSWGSSNSQVQYGQTSSESTADSMTPHVRAHLSRVYALVAAGVASAGVGSALMMMTALGKTIPYFVPMFGGMIPLFWLMWAPPRTVEGRLALFFSFTLIEGMALAPLVKATMIKGVLGTSLLLTGCIFVGFSAAAYLSPRASMLKFQGPLYGMLLGMVAVSLLNMFYPTAFAHSLVLYGGLALFSMFIAVDTQAMVERARCGAGDHVQDALQMFLNVVNIFVRIAQIMRGGD